MLLSLGGGIPILLFFPEIETGIDTERAEGIGHRKAWLPVVVGVEHQGGAHKIFGIIIDNAGTGNQVEVDVLYPTFVLEVLIVYLRLLVADAGQEREIRYPVLGKHPIVAIAETEAVVRILDVTELKTGTQLTEHQWRELTIVERNAVLRIRKSSHERTGTSALVGGLAVCSRI